MRLRDELAARRQPAVLIIDNATDPQLVNLHRPSTGAMQVIITSIDRAFGSLGTAVDVDIFDRAQSVAYLAKRTGCDDAAGAAAVAEELGDLPLALAQPRASSRCNSSANKAGTPVVLDVTYIVPSGRPLRSEAPAPTCAAKL